MKKIKFGIFGAVIFLVAFFGLKSENNEVHGQDESRLYVYGQNEYELNGIISIASTDEPAINISGHNVWGEIALDVYEADMDDVLNFLVHDEKNDQKNPDVSLDGHKKVTSIKSEKEGKMVLPLEGTGVWLLHAQSGGASVKSFLIRSSYGAVAKESDDKFLFWVQSFENRRSVSDAKVKVYSLNDRVSEKYEVKTNVEGIVEGSISARYDVAIVGQGNNKALIPLNLRYLNYGGSWSRFEEKVVNTKFFTFTDRPLYKPGDKMFFKTVLREDDDVRYSIPSGKVWVELVNGLSQEREVVFSGEYAISSLGTISGEIEIPDNIKTGSYFLVVKENKDDETSWNSSYVNLLIEYYQKPEFGLDMELRSDEIISGDNMEVDFQGDYFSGQPLKGYEVQYTVRESDFYDYSYYGYDYNIDNYRYGYRWGKEVLSGSVTLDERGHAMLSLPANVSNAKTKIYSIEASIEALGNQSVEAKNVLVRSGQYGIYRKDRNYGTKIGKEIDMQFALKAYAGVSLSNREISIEPKRIWWEKKENVLGGHPDWEKHEENLGSFGVKSNESGEFGFKFKPEKEGSHILSISLKDERGNKIEKEFSVWVSNRDGYYFSGESDSDLSVNLDKESYDPGETASITVSSVFENRDVLMTFEGDEVHRYRVVSLNGKSATIQEKMRDTDAPNIFVDVASFSNYRLDRADADVEVSAKGKKLFVTMKSNQEHYSPGDTAEVEILAKDQNGVPQEADLAVWAVDKAIFELASKSNGDIFNYFWKRRYYGSMTAHSLEGINIHMAEQGGCFLEGTQVQMSDGTEKNIEDVSVGEYVLTRNENSKEMVLARVSKTHSTKVSGYLNINNNLRLTDNHILRVNGTWKKAGDIRIGDNIVDKEGNNIEVSSLVWQKKDVEVYNLEIENEHSYFANGIWVHNGKDGGARSVFSDTAYWNPRVRTDRNGFAKVSFVVPDNLTTWVVSAVGSTKDSKMGEMSTEIVSSKDVIIRPQLPNILYKDDRLLLAALAQNSSDQERTFRVGMKFDSGDVENQEQTVTIPANDSKFVEWNLNVSKENQDAKFEFYMEAVDSDDAKLRDSVILGVPVKKFGYQETSAWMENENLKFDFKISDDTDLEKTSIKLSMSATLLGSLSPAMNYLAKYPYGCVEQTTSRFVPAIIVKENPDRFRDILDDKDIDKFLDVGVKRLTKMQNKDGGWTWSFWGKTDAFVTAYVSEYLLRAKSLRVDVNQNVLDGAKKYFENTEISRMSDKDLKIVILYGRSLFGSSKDRQEITDFSDVSSDIVSLAVITNIKNGYRNSSTNGVDHLKAMANYNDQGVFWNAGSLERFGTEHTSTALAVRALVMAGEKSEIVTKAIKYLSETRDNRYWSNTFATVQVIQSFIDFSRLEEEVIGDVDYKLLLNNKEISKGIVGKSKRFERINISLTNDLKNDSTLSIEKESDKSIYSSLVIDEFRTSRNASPVSKGMTITRKYVNSKGSEYNIVPGDIVNVELNIEGIALGAKYLVIEDQLPSGLVVVNERFENVKRSGSDELSYYQGEREYTENGIVILVNTLHSHSYTYKARAVSVGDFIAPPATASLMYKPEIYAHSGVNQVNVDKEVVVYETKKSEKEIEEERLKSYKAEVIVILLALGVSGALAFLYWKGYLRKE